MNSINQIIGNHTGRVDSLEKLFEIQGKNVWLVSTITDHEAETPNFYCSSCISKIAVGDITTQGKVITSATEYDPAKNKDVFMFVKNMTIDVDGVKSEYLVSLLDYNVVESDNVTTYAMFTSKKEAERYQVWMKMKWPIHESFEKMLSEFSAEDSILQAKVVERSEIVKK